MTTSLTRTAGKLSVVIPFFNEEGNIPDLFSRLIPVLNNTGVPYEVICVDDGSRDRTLELLKSHAEKNPGRVVVLELVRNAGQHPAIMAGFRHVSGEWIITLDADLQNPPEQIPKLLAKMREGFDVVGGVRQERQDSFFRKFASRQVNRLTRVVTGMNLRDYGCMLRGYSRDVIEEINGCEESSTFIPALALLFARKPIEIEVEHSARGAGRSKYSLYKLIRLNFDLMTGFSVVPLQIFTLFGFLVSLSGVALGIYLLLRRFVLLRHSEAEGVFTLMAFAFVVMGVAMSGIGIVGEYVGRIYQEVRARPRFRVKKIHGESTVEHRETVKAS